MNEQETTHYWRFLEYDSLTCADKLRLAHDVWLEEWKYHRSLILEMERIFKAYTECSNSALAAALKRDKTEYDNQTQEGFRLSRQFYDARRKFSKRPATRRGEHE